ncbi:MAG TPA: YadA C-terminal domain-containing protein [Xanthomonadaceae bacterium]|nr:YadA C-terminal domain-containing protein [Xanthomonadaceae bacterium]
MNLAQMNAATVAVVVKANAAMSTANTALTTADNALAASNAQVTALAGSAGANAIDAGDAQTLVAANAGDATTLAAANAHTDTTAFSTLASANTYTDTRVNALSDDFNSFKSDVNTQFAQQDSKINTVGALSAALSMIGPDGRIAGDNQFSMGVGNFHNQQAISMGFSRLITPHASVRLGAAFASGENEAGVGFNVGW